MTSFINISDPAISSFSDNCFARGALWPEPLIQLNPTFKPGKTIDELIDEGSFIPNVPRFFAEAKPTWWVTPWTFL